MQISNPPKMTTSVTELIDHNKTVHDALGISAADADIASEINSPADSVITQIDPVADCLAINSADRTVYDDYQGHKEFTGSGNGRWIIRVPKEFAQGLAYLDSVKVYYWTGGNNTYITQTKIFKISTADGSQTALVDDSTDKGNGSSGYENFSETVDYALEAGYNLQIYMSITFSVDNCKIYRMEAIWHLT